MSRAARLAALRHRARRRRKLASTVVGALAVTGLAFAVAAIATGVVNQSPNDHTTELRARESALTVRAGAADPAPPFVACGANRNAAMKSPYTTFAAAKTRFPNTSYVNVPAGDNSGLIGQSFNITPNTTYYFEPGVHTIGGGQFAQIHVKAHDVFVGAPDAVLDGQDQNDFAFTSGGNGPNVQIDHLEVRHFVSPLDRGVVNHDADSHWRMAYNYMHDNGGAAMILGDNNTAQHNCLDHNAQYGFQVFGDTVDVSFNEISRNDSANVESSNPGCGCSGGMKAWEARNVVMNDNWVHDNMNVGLWVDTNNVGFDISNNVITDNTAEAIIYETSYNFHITNNYIARNDFVQGSENKGFPNPAIYISESGGDSRVGSAYATSEIAHNTLADNWGGVTLWENANRYCAGAGGDNVCTLVKPRVATRSTCGSTLLATQPYIDDCRWKTQNVSVHDNTFSLTAANVPNCTAANDCANTALISQSGGCPDACSPGDPYLGDFVMDNITFHQNNHFSNNTYEGPWRFEVHEQNTHVSFSGWQDSPYNQDAGSTLTPMVPGNTTTTATSPPITSTSTTTTTTTVRPPPNTTTTAKAATTTSTTSTTVPPPTSTTTSTTTPLATTTSSTSKTSTTSEPTTTSTTSVPTTTSRSTTSSTIPALGSTTATSVPRPHLSAGTVVPGGSLTINDNGWAPHSKVDIELHSEPVSLGSAQADREGAIKTTVVIPADSELGEHQIVLAGTARNGDPQTRTVAVTVSTVTTGAGSGSASAPSSGTSSDLPRTGGPESPLLIMSLSLLGAGIALVARRRGTV